MLIYGIAHKISKITFSFSCQCFVGFSLLHPLAEMLTHAQAKHRVTKFTAVGVKDRYWGGEEGRILGYSAIVALVNKPF